MAISNFQLQTAAHASATVRWLQILLQFQLGDFAGRVARQGRHEAYFLGDFVIGQVLAKEPQDLVRFQVHAFHRADKRDGDFAASFVGLGDHRHLALFPFPFPLLPLTAAGYSANNSS